MENTITFTGKVSTHPKQAVKGGYKLNTNYTRTWLNQCPFCGGKLANNPKGTVEGELTCKSCDADFCGVTGLEKLVKSRKALVDVNGKKNTNTKVNFKVGTASSGDVDGKVTEYEYTVGYNKDNPFQAYLQVDYDKYILKDGKYVLNGTHTIYIDWSEKMISNERNSFSATETDGSEMKLKWQNNFHTKCRIEILDKIQTAEGLYADYEKESDTNKYIINKIFLKSDPIKTFDDKETEDEDESLVYNPLKDRSTHKMLLYNIGFYNGDVINNKTLGVSGKTLLDSLKNILEETKYFTYMKYDRYRTDDTLNIQSLSDLKTSDIKATFSEGLDGNVLGVSNVTYAPVQKMVNTDIIVYKDTVRNEFNSKDIEYYCNARTSNLDNILRYGEFSKLENSDNANGFAEAKQKSEDNYELNFKDGVSYTLTTVGYPNVKVNDFVNTLMTNQQLTNTYQVCSISVKVDVKNRPMIQTSLGLDDVDYSIKISRNLEAQRKQLIKTSLDINKPILYGQGDDLWSE